MRLFIRISSSVLLLSYAIYLHAQCEDTPDVVLMNAHVITMNPLQPEATAVAIKDGLIQKVGDIADMLALMPEDCPVQWIDAEGHTILPGFNDAHCHWLSWREHICDTPDEHFTTYPPLEEIMDTLSSNGWTSISELNFGRPDFITDHLENAMALDANGDLHVRINGYWGTYDDEELIDVLQTYGYGPGHVFSDRIRVPGVKMYVDDPFGTMDIMDQAIVTQLVSKAHQAGFQVAAHCVNQSAVGKIITAYENALGDSDNSIARHRIEHAVKVSDSQFQRMEDKGIVASIQLMGPPDWPDQNTFQTYISNTNTGFVLRWKDFVESTIPTVGSTDAPFNNSVCHYSPFRAIYQAVTRMGYLDRPHAQWELDQRIAIEEALKLLTIQGAWVTKEEHIKGSIEEGKYADLTVVSANPLMVSDTEELLDIRSVLTMVGGNIEFCSGELPVFCDPPTAFVVDTMLVTISSFLDQEKPGRAFDGDENTNWGAGDFPPQYIQIDFLRDTELDRLELVVGQFPDGFTLHRLSGAQDGASTQLEDLHTFGGVTNDNQVLSYTFDPTKNTFRYLRITTIQSPSWVAWKEIRVFKEGATAVQAPEGSNAHRIIVYPNPAGNRLLIELDLAEAQRDLQIHLLSVDGRKVAHVHSGSITTGKHILSVDLDSLDKPGEGNLLLTICGGNMFSAFKVIIR